MFRLQKHSDALLSYAQLFMKDELHEQIWYTCFPLRGSHALNNSWYKPLLLTHCFLPVGFTCMSVTQCATLCSMGSRPSMESAKLHSQYIWSKSRILVQKRYWSKQANLVTETSKEKKSGALHYQRMCTMRDFDPIYKTKYKKFMWTRQIVTISGFPVHKVNKNCWRN
jgi:hypothetical protein